MKIKIAVAILFISSSLLAQTQNRIAVLDLKQSGLSQAEYAGITDIVRSSITRLQNAAVIDRGTMNRALGDKKFNISGCADSECASEAAKIIKSDRVVYGLIVKTGNKFTLTMRLFNPEGSKNELTEKYESESIRDFTPKMDGFSASVNKLLPVKAVIQEKKDDDWNQELKSVEEKERERKYGVKYYLAINTGYLYIDYNPVFNYQHSILVGMKFQVEFLGLIRAGVIGELAVPAENRPGLSPVIGWGGLIISFPFDILPKKLYMMVDLVFVGGGCTSTGAVNSGSSIFNISPRVALLYFPTDLFGLELTVGYNYLILGQYGAPASVLAGINFIFRL